MKEQKNGEGKGGKYLEKGKFFVEEKKTKQENIWRRKCKTEKEKEENIWRRIIFFGATVSGMRTEINTGYFMTAAGRPGGRIFF